MPQPALSGERIIAVPLLTIIMPAYNAARTIVRAMESVRAQQLGDWRLIVVDDASSDGTGERAQEIAAADQRIEVLRNSINLGAASSMNLAWRRTDSRYVAILDADDAALPLRFSVPVAHLKENPAIAVLGGAAYFVDGTGQFLRTVTMPISHAALERRRWYACPFVHPSVTMKREFLDTLGGYTDGLRLGEDYDLWMRGFHHGAFHYANLPEPLVIYTAKPVQRWTMIKASARVRLVAGRREGRTLRGWIAATRILGEGAIEQTGVFAWRDRVRARPIPPSGLRNFGVKA